MYRRRRESPHSGRMRRGLHSTVTAFANPWASSQPRRRRSIFALLAPSPAPMWWAGARRRAGGSGGRLGAWGQGAGQVDGAEAITITPGSSPPRWREPVRILVAWKAARLAMNRASQAAE